MLLILMNFLVEVPYGQAGKNLILTASATELRANGSARTVETLAPVVVKVEKDTLAPEFLSLNTMIPPMALRSPRKNRFPTIL